MPARLLTLVLAVLGVLPAGVATAQTQACGCDAPSDDEAFDRAVHVFEARAVGEVELVIPEGSEPADGWSMVVTGVAKGEVPIEQLVAVPPSSDACPGDFEVGGEYLVFADESRDDLPAAVVAVAACSGTRAASEPFAGDLTFREPPARLGDGDVPVDNPFGAKAEGDRLTMRALIGFTAIISATTALAVWLWRTRPES